MGMLREAGKRRASFTGVSLVGISKGDVETNGWVKADGELMRMQASAGIPDPAFYKALDGACRLAAWHNASTLIRSAQALQIALLNCCTRTSSAFHPRWNALESRI